MVCFLSHFFPTINILLDHATKSVRAAVTKILSNGHFINNRKLFLIVLEAGSSQMRVTARLGSGGD